ncbi:pyruvate formate lyase family protein [Desulfatibacillum aliphaticivorans]|uniref:pyruvate formate lyase family protein n=1 Tax=Desulfatibacillum aliphaticivorans TaxID=218208 RepID=UPI00042708D4|nr:pyruvate formate lyase family protein [Desulfatibacillum aliphaticivorans]
MATHPHQEKNVRDHLVVKTVRNIRKHGGREEDADKGMYRPDIRLDLERSILLTESYKATEGEPMVLRRAKALDHILSNMTLYIQNWEKIVGNNVATPQGLFFGIDMNWRSVRRIVDQDEAKTLLDDEGRKTLDELIEYWKGKSMSDIQQKMFTGPVLECWQIPKGGAGTWSHWSELGVPDYEKAFELGFSGLIKQCRARLVEIDQTVPLDYVDQKEFLQAVIISLEAVIKFARRFAALAWEKAAQTDDPADRARLEAVAKVCDRAPERPPETLHEALQSFFFIHVVRYIEFSTLGIGVRFDKVFGPYYKKDLEAGRIAREEALELLQLLWLKFHELGLIYSPTLSAIYGGVAALQAICIGGVDETGKDVTNEMTYLVLDCAEKMRSPEPTIALRYHDGTPRELISRAVDVIRTGVGYPAFFNDKAILPLLERWEVPLHDARDYSISGCVYLELPGKNISHRAYGGFILPAALLYALSQGRDAAGNLVGAPTPDPMGFAGIEDLMDAYEEQVRYMFQRLCTIENTCQTLYERHLPRPFYSALLEGCIEKGMETKKWGYPSPVANICIVLGPVNVSDAMAAIQKNVFEEKTVAMEDLLAALASNWEGYEHVRRLMINAPKFGNDDDYADRLAVEVQHRSAAAMEKAKNRFGVSCRGDGSGISATYAAGAFLPATPDGRMAGEPLSDATLSPVFGMDKKGPTAVLKSASKISTKETFNHLLNQKFLPQALSGDMKEVFIDYIRSWGDLGVSQIQFNVVDPQTLLNAQENPEEHADLLVRVAGYSAYFVDLSKGLQDSIIARTEQNF